MDSAGVSKEEQFMHFGDDLFVQALDSCSPARNAQVGDSSFLGHFDAMWPNLWQW